MMDQRSSDHGRLPASVRQRAEQPTTADGQAPVRIVGIGASAGGLEPLLEFLAQVPVASGLAYIVVQHLDPTRRALLPEILQRATTMPVREVSSWMRITANSVYVIPPNAELTVVNGMIRLSEPSEPRGLRLPVDVLFCSLAREQAEHAIGVVLSGMGTDGTLGMQAIKSQGGLTVAQTPDSARYGSMPRTAVASGMVDMIGAVADLPRRILAVVASQQEQGQGQGRPETVGSAAPPEDTGDVHAPLAAILELLRIHSRYDLALYKPSTLRRRIERRMAIHGLSRMADYAAYLAANSAELALLFKEMLIGVTGFFRDPEVWDILRDLVWPELFARSEPGRHFRAWVPGCSTGEEAFTLAMVFQEALTRWVDPTAFSLQVFATDLNADAIAAARRGRYGATMMAGLGQDRLARFFRIDGADYVVDPGIREMVLFAQHDVNMDPPFTRLDLLSCRNLLIYFSATLQKRLMPLFHYSLVPGGILVLGESETVGGAHNLFRPLSPTVRLYRRDAQDTATSAVHFPVNRRSVVPPHPQEQAMSRQPPNAVNLQVLADQLLLQRFCPAAVLVNELGDILYINGRTGAYLEPAAGRANWNVHVMARAEIRAPLAIAMRKAIGERVPVTVQGIPLEDTGKSRLDLLVESVDAPSTVERMVMIVFREVPAGAGRRPRRNVAVNDLDTSPAVELLRAQEDIAALRAAMRTAEEDRQAAIEELQSTNEELQSANEELTTSKEEAQSMNEELQTINAELRCKLDDLALAQSDMQNLLNSTDIATLFLDKDLNVRRFTEKIKRIIHLRDADVGRPLSDLATTLDYGDFRIDAMETLRTLVFCEKEVSTNDGHWFKVRIMPYRTVSNVIQGAVITFVDITAAKELESRLRKA